MTAWTPEEIEAIGSTDDFHISPHRDDGTTPGTPTWIWSVVVDGDVYVRAYNGIASRWYRSALTQRAGRIRAGGLDAEVAFAPVDDAALNDRRDQAYSQKYAGSPYLPPMIAARTRAATVRVERRAEWHRTARHGARCGDGFPNPCCRRSPRRWCAGDVRRPPSRCTDRS